MKNNRSGNRQMFKFRHSKSTEPQNSGRKPTRFRSEIVYMDDQHNTVDQENATVAHIHEFDENGRWIQETVGHFRDPQKVNQETAIFSYTLRNAWRGKLNELELILTENRDFLAKYSLYDHKSAVYFSEKTEAGQICLPTDILNRISSLLENDMLFEVQRLEDAYNMACLDGYCQEFSITWSGRHINVSGDNIDICRDDTVHCPHSVAMIYTLETMQAILVPFGVPKACFRITC